MACPCPALSFDQTVKSRASEEISRGTCLQHAATGGRCNLKLSQVDEDYGSYLIQGHLLDQANAHYVLWELRGSRLRYLATVLPTGPGRYGAIVNQLGSRQHYLSRHPEVESGYQAILNWVIDLVEDQYYQEDQFEALSTERYEEEEEDGHDPDRTATGTDPGSPEALRSA